MEEGGEQWPQALQTHICKGNAMSAIQEEPWPGMEQETQICRKAGKVEYEQVEGLPFGSYIL